MIQFGDSGLIPSDPEERERVVKEAIDRADELMGSLEPAPGCDMSTKAHLMGIYLMVQELRLKMGPMLVKVSLPQVIDIGRLARCALADLEKQEASAHH
jgi:hypothetical protein